MTSDTYVSTDPQQGNDSAVPVTVCGIVGSLRAGSWNAKLMQAAMSLAPPDLDIRPTSQLAGIPLFNEDLVGSEPDGVLALKAEIAASDALLIATPEYNGGVPGVLKNALDWVSLPLGHSVLQRKPVAIMGASPGRLGTARSQLDLRTTFIFSQSPVIPGPEVIVTGAAEKFDDNGELTDEYAIMRVSGMLDSLRTYCRLFAGLGADS